MKSIKKYLIHPWFLAFTFLCLSLIGGYNAVQASPMGEKDVLLLGQSDGMFNQKSAIWFYLIVLCLFIGWTLGRKIGFITNLLCYIGGYVLAVINEYLNEPIMNLLVNLGFESDSYIRVGTSLIILVMFLALLKLIDKLIKIVVKMLFLKAIDNFLGAVLGVIEACVAVGAFYCFMEIYEAKKAFGIDVNHLPFFEAFKQLTESVLGSSYLDWVKDFIDSLPS